VIQNISQCENYPASFSDFLSVQGGPCRKERKRRFFLSEKRGEDELNADQIFVECVTRGIDLTDSIPHCSVETPPGRFFALERTRRWEKRVVIKAPERSFCQRFFQSPGKSNNCQERGARNGTEKKRNWSKNGTGAKWNWSKSGISLTDTVQKSGAKLRAWPGRKHGGTSIGGFPRKMIKKNRWKLAKDSQWQWKPLYPV
jgi:hypothetical protein